MNAVRSAALVADILRLVANVQDSRSDPRVASASRTGLRLDAVGPNPVLGTLTERRLAAQEQAQRARQQAIQIRTPVLDTIQTLTEGRDRRSVLQHSAYARLAAPLETMPVVEQAKGI